MAIDNPGENKERMAEFYLRNREKNLSSVSRMANNADNFLKNGTPVNPAKLDGFRQSVEFLDYADEDGRFSPAQDIYEVEKGLSVSSKRLYDMSKRNEVTKTYYDTFSRAQDAWRFMRNPSGDTSHAMPASLTKEMTEVGKRMMQKMDKFFQEKMGFDKEVPEDELAALCDEVKKEISAVQQKANPYIAADMHVSVAHMGEFEGLLAEFVRAGRVAKVNIDGDMVRLLLTKMYPDEFQKYFDEYEKGRIREAGIKERGRIIELSNNAYR